MSAGLYVVGLLTLALPGAGAALVGVELRRRLLPAMRSAAAWLADAVIALSVLEVLLQVVALVGLLRRPVLLATGALLVGVGLVLRRSRITRGTAEPPADPVDREAVPLWQRGVAVAATSLVVGLWLGQIAWTLRHGVFDYDSIDYHLPVALDWYQTGRLGGLPHTTPDLAVPSYPFGSELFHAAGMVAFDRDVLTPLLNLGWLGLLLLAGWVVGSAHRVPGVTLAAVAVVAGLPQIAHLEAGAALSDVPALAALLASVALLVREYATARSAGGRSAIAHEWKVPLVAGLAAGLAVGAKLTAAPAVAALTVMVALIGIRRLGPWLLGVVAVSGTWFVRNAVLAGSPVPSLHLPLLPRPEYALFDEWQQSVGSYLGDRRAIETFFRPALEQLWGPTWPLVASLGVAGGLLALVAARGAAARAVGLVALLCGVGYIVMPHAAGGPQGAPLLFGGNLRFALPALTLGLVALVLGAARFRAGPAIVSAVFVVPLAAGALAHWRVSGLPYPRHLATGVVALVLGVGLYGMLLLLRRRRATRSPWPALRVSATAVLSLALLVLGLPIFNGYLHDRYATAAPGLNAAYASFRDRSDQRVAVVGIAAKYPYAGTDLSNRVTYVGHDLPRGGFTEVGTCREWRSRLNAGGFGWVVVSPSPLFPEQPPARAWTAEDPGARPVLDSAGVTVFSLDAPPDPARCSP